MINSTLLELANRLTQTNRVMRFVQLANEMVLASQLLLSKIQGQAYIVFSSFPLLAFLFVVVIKNAFFNKKMKGFALRSDLL